MKLLNKSLPQSRKVRGYTLTRLPLEGYLNAIDRLQNIPGGLMEACFPGKDIVDILDELKTLNQEKLTRLIGSLFTAVPVYAVRLIAELTGIEEQELLQDRNIGLDGLAEIVETFWELNGLSNFMMAVRRMSRPLKESIGSKT